MRKQVILENEIDGRLRVNLCHVNPVAVEIPPFHRFCGGNFRRFAGIAFVSYRKSVFTGILRCKFQRVALCVKSAAEINR